MAQLKSGEASLSFGDLVYPPRLEKLSACMSSYCQGSVSCSARQRNLLFERLNEQRVAATLTDVTLVVDDDSDQEKECTFHAHRAVLAASSEYFHAMFTNPMREASLDTVHLQGLPAEGVSAILDYIYTTKLDVDSGNVQIVLAAATHLQILAVISMCDNYLQKELEMENCLDILTIAENYSLEVLRDRAFSFLCRNLQKIQSSEAFARLTTEHFVTMLSSKHFLFDCTELQLLLTILTWLFEHNSSYLTTIKSAADILRHVQFYAMVRKNLDATLDHFFESCTRGPEVKSSVYKMIVDESRKAENMVDLSLCFNTFNTRGMTPALVRIGGFGVSGLTNDLTACVRHERQWRRLSSIPHVEQCNYGTAVLNNELYIVGGCFNQSMQEVIHPYCFRYTVAEDRWVKLQPMSVERCRFSLCVAAGQLYAMGGEREVFSLTDDCESTNSCERYDPVKDTWAPIQPLPENLSQHAAITCTNSAGTFVFVSGGLRRDEISDRMFRYCVKRDTWTECERMLTPRTDHSMFAHGHKVYVCGGWHNGSVEGNEMRRHVETIDAYNTISDQWEEVTTIPTPRYHVASVAVREEIFLTGGFLHDAIFFKDAAPIKCYNIITDTWCTAEIDTLECWEHNCVSLYVPTDFIGKR